MYPVYNAVSLSYASVWNACKNIGTDEFSHVQHNSLKNFAIRKEFYHSSVSVELKSVIPYLIVWDWSVSRAKSISYYWNNCFLLCLSHPTLHFNIKGNWFCGIGILGWWIVIPYLPDSHRWFYFYYDNKRRKREIILKIFLFLSYMIRLKFVI